jgi:hypothetical protein
VTAPLRTPAPRRPPNEGGESTGRAPLTEPLGLTILAEIVERVALRVAELVAEQLHAPASAEPWKLLSTAEVAAALGRSERWVRDRRKDGSLPWVRLDGGPPAFRLEDVHAFAEARRIACDPINERR